MVFFFEKLRKWTWAAALCLLFASFPASVHAQETQTGSRQSDQTEGIQSGSEQDSRTGIQSGSEQDNRTGIQTDSGQDSRMVLTTQVKGHPGDIEDGKAEVELPNGTIITVEDGSLPDGLLLVVESVEAGDADYERIAAYMEGLGTNLRVYDIYFVDSNGQRYEAPETVTVTISLNGAYQSPAIYYVSPENGASRADSSVKNDRISFRLFPDGTQNIYYVLVEQKSPSGDPGNGGATGGTGGSGDDGDTSDGSSGSGGENGGGTGSAGSTGNADSGEGAGNAGGADSTAGAGNAGSADGSADVENAGRTGSIGGTGSTGSNTGDEANLTLWLLACIGAASVLVLVFAAGKSQEKRGRKS